MLAGFKADGEDSDALLDAYIKLYNDCLSERPSDMHVGVHLCRGNFVGGRHFSEGGYDAIATKLFRNLNVEYLLLLPPTLGVSYSLSLGHTTSNTTHLVLEDSNR
jgi:methionine synthase II (cobalamin-independent)